MRIGLNLPLNNVSFGQLSLLILRNLFERQKAGQEIPELFLFPIGQIDYSSQQVPNDFHPWLQDKIKNAYENYSRDIPVFKLWHLNGSVESYSKCQTLLTFYELDSPTRVECNIAKNNNLVLTSNYTKNVFSIYDVDSHYVQLPFDHYNFKVVNKKYNTDGRIVFNLCGKFEKRKGHEKVIRSWKKAFGNNAKYWLQCATFNPHLNQQDNDQMIRQSLNGEQKPFNINFYPMMKENIVYNDFLNSSNIIIDMSGGEGYSVPTATSLALGKHAVILNAHVFKDYATPENAVLVNPSGKIDSEDGIFFRKDSTFNVGNIFDFNEDDFITGCKEAISRVESNPVNLPGLNMQKLHADQFVDSIINLTNS